MIKLESPSNLDFKSKSPPLRPSLFSSSSRSPKNPSSKQGQTPVGDSQDVRFLQQDKHKYGLVVQLHFANQSLVICVVPNAQVVPNPCSGSLLCSSFATTRFSRPRNERQPRNIDSRIKDRASTRARLRSVDRYHSSRATTQPSPRNKLDPRKINDRASTRARFARIRSFSTYLGARDLCLVDNMDLMLIWMQGLIWRECWKVRRTCKAWHCLFHEMWFDLLPQYPNLNQVTELEMDPMGEYLTRNEIKRNLRDGVYDYCESDYYSD